MKKKKILLVDDDKVLTDMYATKFGEHGWETEVAGSVAKAQKIADNFVPDLVILDIIMPGENGIEFLKRMDKIKNLEKAKVFLLSNLDYRAEVDKEIADRISGYFLKASMTPTEFSQKINEIL